MKPVLLDGLMTTRDAREMGIDRHRLARGGYERVRRGLYVPSGTPVNRADARIAIAASCLPDGVALGGWAAARLHERAALLGPEPLVVFDDSVHELGARDGPAPVLVCAPRSARLNAHDGIAVLRSDTETDERTVLGGAPVTSALRTAFDLARLRPTSAAVIALDRLRNLGLVDAEALDRMVRGRKGWRGIGRARRALELSDDGAESPRETLLRLIWMEAGFPRPLTNPEVRDLDGRFVARVDLLDPEAGVVGEYDGAFHAAAPRRSRDAFRQEELEGLGLLVIRANSPDLAGDRARRSWQHRLRQVYARARTFPRPRAWRILSQ